MRKFDFPLNPVVGDESQIDGAAMRAKLIFELIENLGEAMMQFSFRNSFFFFFGFTRESCDLCIISESLIRILRHISVGASSVLLAREEDNDRRSVRGWFY